MSIDTAIVRAGRVEQVCRGGWPSFVPSGAEVVAAPGGAVHPGMHYDYAGRMFLASKPQTPVLPLSRVSLPSGVSQVVAAIPSVAPLAQAPGANAVNHINITVNSPHAAVPVPPVQAPASFPCVAPAAPELAGVVEPVAVPPLPPPAASSRERALDGLRRLQTEAWPPEREQMADLAATFLSYRDPALVPDLVAIVPPDMTVDEVARVALEARATAQKWIADIGDLIAREVPAIETDAQADDLIARARVIVEGVNG